MGWGSPPPGPEPELSPSLLSLQPASVTLKAPSAVSVAQWGVSVRAKPMWLASTATAAPQEPTASESTAVPVSVWEVEERRCTRLAGRQLVSSDLVWYP